MTWKKKDTGKKNSQAFKGKRKGGRSNRVPPVTSTVDRPFNRNVSTQEFMQAAQVHPSALHLTQEVAPTQHSMAAQPAVPTQNINFQSLQQPMQAQFAAPCSTQQGPRDSTSQVLQSMLPPVRTSFTPQPTFIPQQWNIPIVFSSVLSARSTSLFWLFSNHETR